MEYIQKDFDGVFRLTNPTDEDFTFLWNNKEYVFAAGKTSPMIIANETLENIQEIRKKAAFKLAVREFHKGKDYTKMSKMGAGLPPTFDEKVLEPMINQCLTPLPEARATVKQGKPIFDEKRLKGSKAVSGSDNLNASFKDEEIIEKGVMPETLI